MSQNEGVKPEPKSELPVFVVVTMGEFLTMKLPERDFC